MDQPNYRSNYPPDPVPPATDLPATPASPPAHSPHGGTHVWPQQLSEQLQPPRPRPLQSALVEHGIVLAQLKSFQQMGFPATSTSQTHRAVASLQGVPPQVVMVSPHAHGGHAPAETWANAGVLKLLTTGTVQAMVVATPIRFSILRREIPSFVTPSTPSTGSSGMFPPLRVTTSTLKHAARHDSAHHPSGAVFATRQKSGDRRLFEAWPYVFYSVPVVLRPPLYGRIE